MFLKRQIDESFMFLILACLSPKPEKRPTATEMFESEWIQKCPTELSYGAKKELKKFFKEE